MRYCVRCLKPANDPLYISFDEHGVCSGCRVHEEKDVLDWAERHERLLRVVEPYRDKSGFNYDCIVPVSNIGDAYFVVHYVKTVLEMNPLLVHYNGSYNTQTGIRNLSRLWTKLDCDHIKLSCDPGLLRRVTRASLKLRGSMYWHCLAGAQTFPVRMAVRMRIPLIIWGVNGWLDQVGKFSHLDEVEMSLRARREHGMMNLEADELLTAEEGVGVRDLANFSYPSDEELAAVGVRGIYLGNYLRWDAKTQHELMIDTYGYETTLQSRTFDTYEDVGCLHSAGLHDWIKYLKWGFGKVSDHASREIRLRRLTREDGIQLVHRYQQVQPADLDVFLEWIDMTQSQLIGHIDRFRDPRIWGKDLNGWRLLDSVEAHANDPRVEANRLVISGTCDYRVTSCDEDRSGYVVNARGWRE